MHEVKVYECVLREQKTIHVAERAARHNEATARIVHAMTHDSPSEKLIALYVDTSLDVIGAEIVAIGGRYGCSATPRELLRGAIIANADAIIVGHNHPSGNPSPSREDVEFTRVLRRACDSVGIPLLDHVIVTRDPKAWASVITNKHS